MIRSVFAVAVLAAFLASCAKRPDAISATTVPMAAYQNLDCQQLTSSLGQEQQNLAALSKVQNNAATGDAVFVFLVGVPVASLADGDKEGEIAVSKGKILAMEQALMAKSCDANVAPADPQATQG